MWKTVQMFKLHLPSLKIFYCVGKSQNAYLKKREINGKTNIR